MLPADGSVRFTKADSIDSAVFRTLITYNGGEIIDWGRMPKPTPRPQPDRQGGLLHVDPSLIPGADELRKPLLFPGSLAVVSDREGIRLVSRESFPSVRARRR